MSRTRASYMNQNGVGCVDDGTRWNLPLTIYLGWHYGSKKTQRGPRVVATQSAETIRKMSRFRMRGVQ